MTSAQPLGAAIAQLEQLVDAPNLGACQGTLAGILEALRRVQAAPDPVLAFLASLTLADFETLRYPEKGRSEAMRVGLHRLYQAKQQAGGLG